MSLRIVFMGTPDFAVPSLDILIQNGFNVVGVITATDKWGGRGGKKLLESDVKKYAVEKGLKILQPKNLKSPDFQAELKALNADIQVVVAFRMLPEAVWNMPRLGTLNVHGSLLPKYRGAAPINWAIINGEKETGVTTFFLKHKIDTGDLLYQAKTEIDENETVGELYGRLKFIGADLLLKTMQHIDNDNYTTHQQDESLVCHAPKIFHDTCRINFDQETEKVHNFIRGMSPYPAAWCTIANEKYKIFRTVKEYVSHEEKPGTLVSDGKKYLKIATIDGFINILEIQATKRKRMEIKSFLNGSTIEATHCD